jgi:hypothetical protein
MTAEVIVTGIGIYILSNIFMVAIGVHLLEIIAPETIWAVKEYYEDKGWKEGMIVVVKASLFFIPMILAVLCGYLIKE